MMIPHVSIPQIHDWLRLRHHSVLSLHRLFPRDVAFHVAYTDIYLYRHL